MSAPALLFVYHADAGPLAALFDAAHKLLAPASYPCSLCAITYGAVAMKPRWKAWLAALPHRKAFYHKQDFARAYPAYRGLALPAILIDRGDGAVPLVEAAALNALPDLEALIALLEVRLAQA